MLKTSLLTAAAAFVIMAAAPISSHAQDTGLRQIVVDPTAKSGGGGGDGSGAGTGGGGQNGTGGGKNKPAIIANPAGTASLDTGAGAAPIGPAPDAGNVAPIGPAASGDAGDKAKVIAPVATLGANPGAGKPDALDAIVGAPSGNGTDNPDLSNGGTPGNGAPVAATPGDGSPTGVATAPAETGKADGPHIQSVDGLIGALRTGGFVVDIDHRDSKGDYYLVVTTPKDHSLGYLLTVDDKTGYVLEKKSIDPTEYGYYAETHDYGKPKEIAPTDSYSGDSSGGDDSNGGYSDGGSSNY